jgi:hypothetical protein
MPGNQERTLRRRAALQAGGGLFALIAGWTATVHADGATWFGVRGPQCPLGACLGPLACPGCGLVRSTAAALQGDLSAAFAMHPTGPVVAGLLFGSLALHLHVLHHGHESPRHRRLRRFGHSLFVVGLLGGWALRALTP